MKSINLVTGYWHIRQDRKKSTYLENFKNVLSLAYNMTVFVPRQYESFVQEYRSPLSNKTNIVIVELDDIKNKYFIKYWDKLQNIRTDSNWYNSTDWLLRTPQAFSEWYNPIVMSKVFFLYDAYNMDTYDSDNFIWIDAGITQHISKDIVCEKNINGMSNHIKTVLFSSIDYVGTEIHGFDYSGYKKYTDIIPTWLCRATILGCHKSSIEKFKSDYAYYLTDTLERGYLGTEESIYSLLSCIDPRFYVRYHTTKTSMPDLFLEKIKYEK